MPIPAIAVRRRTALRLVATGIAALALASCNGGDTVKWNATSVAGTSPDLSFTMSRVSDGKQVSASDYRGKVVLLYFGYTFCPDVCPQTLSNLGLALQQIGTKAQDVRVLFVTVDPDRDTPEVLAQYVKAFGPQFVGLRGTPDQLARLAKRYRVAYSVDPNKDPSKYVVTHSSAIYAFDREGHARLLITDMSTTNPDIAATAQDLKHLVDLKD